MTDERLAEIEAEVSAEWFDSIVITRAEELLSALKAERERVEELEAHGLCRCADEVRCDMRKLITACEPYLKDGETPAECIQRNRDDTGAVMKLLEKEKRKYDALVKGVTGCLDRWKKRQSRPWQPCAQPETLVQELRALLGDDDE